MDEPITINHLKERILDSICQQQRAFFRSQQINDPELTFMEKQEICRNLLDESHNKFLHRYGEFLNVEQLDFFTTNPHPSDDEYEAKYLQKHLKTTLERREVIVKNRRFMALQKLISIGDYFSEKDMMRRQPLLYDQLVGQYLSDQEVYERDRLDENNFSTCLFEGMDKARIRELRTQQQNSETVKELNDVGKDNVEVPSSDMDTVPQSFRTHWGGFENNSSADLTEVRNNFQTKSQLTLDERDILQQEFFGIMHSNFLSGLDDDVDYHVIDNDVTLDDLKTEELDEQEKYFDQDEEDDDDNEDISNNVDIDY